MESFRYSVEHFVRLVEVGGPLDEMCLTMSWCVKQSMDSSSSFDLVGELSRLDEIAASVPSPTVDGLVSALFRERFVGNRDEYYELSNSLLDDVVSTGRGIPITLSVLMVEVGRRLGIDLALVGLPGHVVVRVVDDDFVDPFHGGRRLDREGCRALVGGLAGRPVDLPDSIWDPMTDLAVVERMTNNAKGICVARSAAGDFLATSALAGLLSLRRALPTIGDSEAEERRRLLAALN